MVNNIENYAISEIDAKKDLNALNEIKNVEIIKYKKRTPGLKKLNDLLDTTLTDKTLESKSQENKNENENENEKVKVEKKKMKMKIMKMKMNMKMKMMIIKMKMKMNMKIKMKVMMMKQWVKIKKTK